MTLPASGTIRLGADVDVELGYSSTTSISLGSTIVRSLYGISSGAIRLAADGYSKSVNKINYRYFSLSTQLYYTTNINYSNNGVSFCNIYGSAFSNQTLNGTPLTSISVSSAGTQGVSVKLTKTGAYDFGRGLTLNTGYYSNGIGAYAGNSTYAEAFLRPPTLSVSSIDSQGGLFFAFGQSNTTSSISNTSYPNRVYCYLTAGRYNSSGTLMWTRQTSGLVANSSYWGGAFYANGVFSPPPFSRPFGSFVDSGDNFYIAHISASSVLPINQHCVITKLSNTGNYINSYAISQVTNLWSADQSETLGLGGDRNGQWYSHMDYDVTTSKLIIGRSVRTTIDGTQVYPMISMTTANTSDDTFATWTTNWRKYITTSANAQPTAVYYDGGANVYCAGIGGAAGNTSFVSSLDVTTGNLNYFFIVTNTGGEYFEITGLSSNTTHLSMYGYHRLYGAAFYNAYTYHGIPQLLVLDYNFSTQSISKALYGYSASAITACRYDNRNDKLYLSGYSSGTLGSNNTGGFFISTNTANRDSDIYAIPAVYQINTSPTDWSISFSTPGLGNGISNNNVFALNMPSTTYSATSTGSPYWQY